MTNSDSNKNRKNELMLYPEFLSESHKDLFYSVVSQLNNSQQKSPEYLSVAFIITSDSELYEKMRPYFDTNGFSSFKMFDEVDFSSGYRKIAVAAANLFGQDYETSLADTINGLGHDLFHTLLQAMIIRKYGVIGK
ncbi:hypothetical protein [Planomicrobium okeanokoites]|uniref:hypothetical protein n=1 Tax=Planomicrobium okeanokoites TaxID=244 RepID=UPI000A03B044|nr:hypothetical protein [Planomicrobium okeanokoites]